MKMCPGFLGASTRALALGADVAAASEMTRSAAAEVAGILAGTYGYGLKFRLGFVCRLFVKGSLDPPAFARGSHRLLVKISRLWF